MPLDRRVEIVTCWEFYQNREIGRFSPRGGALFCRGPGGRGSEKRWVRFFGRNYGKGVVKMAISFVEMKIFAPRLYRIR